MFASGHSKIPRKRAQGMDLKKLFYLPVNASAHGHEIDMVIYLIHLLMFVLFSGWAIYFTIVLIRFNRKKNPRADYYGVKKHYSTYIEIAVAVFEAILLVGFSIPFWIKQVNAFPDRPDSLEIKVVAEQFAWNIHYPGRDKIFGSTDLKFFDKQENPLGLDPDDPNSKDDIVTVNQMTIPIGRPAIIHLSSKDVMHSFSIPVMRVKQDTIPGLSLPVWFTPTKTGKYEIACAQLCGIGHYRMKGYLNVVSEQEFEEWMDEQSASLSTSTDEGEDDFWN